ncbi:MAG: hypothetical protein SH868_17110 [Bythopirellula sp.]|nr:hypothetical protein [Bythopirellula sp.]
MAIGDTLLIFDPLAAHPPATNFATLDLRGDFVVLDFDASTNESAQFHAVVPSHYKGGELRVTLTGTSSTATSGAAKLRVELTRIAAGDNLDSLPSADASADLTVACPATSGLLVVSELSLLSVADLVAGDILRVQVTRLATDAADIMTGDWELVAVVVKED